MDLKSSSSQEGGSSGYLADISNTSSYAVPVFSIFDDGYDADRESFDSGDLEPTAYSGSSEGDNGRNVDRSGGSAERKNSRDDRSNGSSERENSRDDRSSRSSERENSRDDRSNGSSEGEYGRDINGSSESLSRELDNVGSNNYEKLKAIACVIHSLTPGSIMGIMSSIRRYFDGVVEQIGVSYCGAGLGIRGYRVLNFLIHVQRKQPGSLYIHPPSNPSYPWIWICACNNNGSDPNDKQLTLIIT